MKIGIIIVAIIVILFVLGIMTSSPPSPTNEEQVFKQNKVWSFDINPAKHVLYYLAESENQTANKNLVLGK